MGEVWEWRIKSEGSKAIPNIFLSRPTQYGIETFNLVVCDILAVFYVFYIDCNERIIQKKSFRGSR